MYTKITISYQYNVYLIQNNVSIETIYLPVIFFGLERGSTSIIAGAVTFVNRTPFHCPFMCPFCVLSKSGKCLRIRVVVGPGHVA
jgi:hypothetical protein